MTVTFFELGEAGRFGNCCFQLSVTIGYAVKHNIDFVFPKWKYQNHLNIPEKHFIDKDSVKYSIEYKEPNYTYTDIPFQENCSLSGYFQSWKYFDHCKDLISDYLTPKDVPDLKDYCCIHVRRGDYLTYPNHHPTQTVKYYMKAAENIPIKKFMIFSDDIGWCKNNFKGNEFNFNEKSSTISDFSKMVGCSYFIIANSSFSWWAAWLSKNKQKIVVAPSNWFGPALKHNPTTDLIPPEWIII